MTHGITLSGIVLNSPDPPALARFYSRLLGWEVVEESREWSQLRNPNGGIKLSVQIEDIYVPPVWPAAPGAQQMQLHLDVLVDDLEAACAHAVACGATLADFQPQDGVRVHLDPDGHPFCLFVEGS